MTTEERFTVQGDLNVWWMRNRFTDQHKTCHGRLFVATVSLITACVIYTNVSSAVEYLWESCILKRDQVLVYQTTQLHFHKRTQSEVLPLPTPWHDSNNRKAAVLSGGWLKESSSSHATKTAMSTQAANPLLLGAGRNNARHFCISVNCSSLKVTLMTTLISNCLSKRCLTI